MTYDTRSAYPFYTDDGTYRKFLGVIVDMVLWVKPDYVFPMRVLNVVPYDSGDNIRISIQDASDTALYILDSTCGYIYDSHGVLSGMVMWNMEEVVSVAATLVARDPIPWGSVYVLPSVCQVRHSMPMFVFNINGSPVKDSDIGIHGDGLRTKFDGSSINLYQYDEYLNNQYINRVRITSGGTELLDTGSIDGIVTIRPDAESNIRVVTQGEIHITDIITGN